ncbi:MAG: hypothetical protein ACLR56_09120 [Oscillospiraceae bacterium]
MKCCDTLAGSPGIEDITGMGLMLGLNEKSRRRCYKQCINDGVLCLSVGQGAPSSAASRPTACF